jgi:hypothetical protein
MEGNNGVEPFDDNKLFRSTMKKRWDEVLKAYRMYPNDAPTAMLTKSGETALHIAVSSHHSDLDTEGIRKLVEAISPEQAFKVLGMPNDKGDTPLHVAAAVGSVDICSCIATKSHELMEKRNRIGETPFFCAAKHGKLHAFVCLRNVWKKGKKEEVPDEFFRRKDGSNILHQAISGEHFGKNHSLVSLFSLHVHLPSSEHNISILTT